MSQSQDNLVSQVAVERGILKRTYADGSVVYRAEGAYDSRAKKRLASKTFRGKGALANARAHRAAQASALARGETHATKGKVTVEQAAWCFLEAAHAGTLKNNEGRAYKPATLRQYEIGLRTRVLPSLGARYLGDVTQPDLQAWVDALDGASQTVRNTINPLRAIYRAAAKRGYVVKSAIPTEGLDLPARDEHPRDRVATPDEAPALLAALPRAYDRALFATALYAGLRCGELQALTWADVDFEARLIHVRRSWDASAHQFIAPKTDSAVRAALLPAPLVPHLLAWRNHQGTEPTGLVFGAEMDPGLPFVANTVYKRVRNAWAMQRLEPIGLHECRHTAATWMIYASLNIKEVSKRLGHSSVTITLDRYGHLLPGGELEALGLLDEYLARDHKAA